MCPRNWSACLTKSCPPLLFGAHLFACLAIAQTPAAPPTATVSGKVYNSVTNEPLRKADITLSSSNDVPGMDMALRMFGGDAPDPAAREAELVADYQARFANPYIAASRGYVDDVIEASRTRAVVSRALAMLADKRVERPKRKHGNIPL